MEPRREESVFLTSMRKTEMMEIKMGKRGLFLSLENVPTYCIKISIMLIRMSGILMHPCLPAGRGSRRDSEVNNYL
ncbi:MAG: hypothetical protein A2288_02520 [Candidatus Moranbacteria bacterium RIFOXYA12_FULL_44_15]|nr:MAG: hypothetical protein A2288_02520 [Candidatus Moranbacteria bacterium RIFOXYA12_FULL_44_15]